MRDEINTPSQQLLTVADLSRRWQVTPYTVRRFVQDKRLPVIRFSDFPRSPIRFRLSDVEAFEESQLRSRCTRATDDDADVA